MLRQAGEQKMRLSNANKNAGGSGLLAITKANLESK